MVAEVELVYLGILSDTVECRAYSMFLDIHKYLILELSTLRTLPHINM